MKTLPSYEQVSKLLAYDPDTGVLTWRSSRGGVRAGAVAGRLKRNGYVEIGVLGRLLQAHRLAWLLETGAWPTGEIDHLDGSPSNNRISNLRDVTHSANQQNLKRAQSNNSSGFLGVSSCKGSWKAQIGVGGKPRHLGTFDSPEAAHAAYIEAKRKLHPGCTI